MKEKVKRFHLDISQEQMNDLQIQGGVIITAEDSDTCEAFEFYVTTDEYAGEIVDSILSGDLDDYVERLTNKIKDERK